MTASSTEAEAVQIRSVLFVSGLALQELPSALHTAADAVCIDIEDAVPAPRKAEARHNLLQLLPNLPREQRERIMVRINSLRTMDGVADLLGLVVQPGTLAALVLPKVETEDELRWAMALAADAGSQQRFVCIIETNSGLTNCGRIAQVHPSPLALFFGGFDLSAALGAEMAWDPLLYARSRVVHAAAAANVQVIDSPFPQLDDAVGLEKAAAQAKSLGMTGKTAKYASQVEAINTVFTPSDSEIKLALRVVAEFQKDPTRPVVVDGKMVELPSVKRLQRLLARGRP